MESHANAVAGIGGVCGQRRASMAYRGPQRPPKTWVFSAFAKGIQGAFVGHSRGIGVPKRVFRNLEAMEPKKTYGFWTQRTCDSAFELPSYNINTGRDPKNGAEDS